ncbi:hypothetical protein NMY22_g224 [Coprinellus aureogranulatus]|nr:hypothetical protein NMY22_g224 [Coprinellus aureogranulatus]
MSDKPTLTTPASVSMTTLAAVIIAACQAAANEHGNTNSTPASSSNDAVTVQALAAALAQLGIGQTSTELRSYQEVSAILAKSNKR